MVKVYLETYGCWLNKAETGIIKRIIVERGGSIVDKLEEADVIIINTCAVREETELRMLKRIKELSNTGKRLVVAGCLVNVRPYTILKAAPKASLVEPDSLEDIGDVVFNGKQKILVRRYKRRRGLLPRFDGGAVYVIPVETGCLGSCSFCIENVARGYGVKSYPLEAIIDHIKYAVKRGAKEVFLTGQDVAAYGKDIGSSLAELLGRILEEVEGEYKIRIGMMEPWLVKSQAKELVKVMRDERVFNYLHL